MLVGGRNNIVPRFAGACDATGPRGGVQNSEEVIERIDFTLLERLMGGVGGNLWWRSGELDGHTSPGDDSGRSRLGSGSGRDEIPGAGNGAGGLGGLRGDGGGDELDGGRHFVDLK